MMNILSIDEIVSDPKVRSGRPVIRGTGICVSDIVAWHLYGDKLTPDQIATDFRLSLGQVYAALTYYYLHQNEIDEEMRQSSENAKRLLAELEKQGKAHRLSIDLE
jgi:uncharacterized protein (DUF433 family)